MARSVCAIIFNGKQVSVGFDSERTTDAQLQQVISNKFDVPCERVRKAHLEYADIALPVQTALLEDGQHYRLVLAPSVLQARAQMANRQEAGRSPARTKLDGDWEVYRTKDGRPYYYNRALDVSSWKKPAQNVGYSERREEEAVVQEEEEEGEEDGWYWDPWEDDEYFASYSDMGIHEKMIEDKARCETYKMALAKALEKCPDAVVLDVGCGTGLLSLLAAEAGASRVYAVEASGIGETAEEIFKTSRFAQKITLLRGKVEELELPEKVDIIVSEWMGSVLIFESMLESVLFARDRWLKPITGVLLPASATMFAAPLQFDDYWAKHVDFWNEIYGFSYTPARQLAIKSFSRPVWDTMAPADGLLAAPGPFGHMVMKTMSVSDTERVSADLHFVVTKPGVLHAMVIWFDVFFHSFLASPKEPGFDAKKMNLFAAHAPADPAAVSSEHVVVLSTAPDSLTTHWKQDILFLEDPIPVATNDKLACHVELIRHSVYRRHYNIIITLSHPSLSHPIRKVFDRWHPMHD